MVKDDNNRMRCEKKAGVICYTSRKDQEGSRSGNSVSLTLLVDQLCCCCVVRMPNPLRVEVSGGVVR